MVSCGVWRMAVCVTALRTAQPRFHDSARSHWSSSVANGALAAEYPSRRRSAVCMYCHAACRDAERCMSWRSTAAISEWWRGVACISLPKLISRASTPSSRWRHSKAWSAHVRSCATVHDSSDTCETPPSHARTTTPRAHDGQANVGEYTVPQRPSTPVSCAGPTRTCVGNKGRVPLLCCGGASAPCAV